MVELLQSVARSIFISHRPSTSPEAGSLMDEPHPEHEMPGPQRVPRNERTAGGAPSLSLGELAAGLAHELGQPLAAILITAQIARGLLAQDNPDLEKIRIVLDNIIAEDSRAVEILTRIRGMINQERPVFHPVEVDELVRSLVHRIGEEARCSEVAIALDLRAPGVRVSGDAVQLEQALVNLVRNAIQAMEATPTDERLLTIRTAVSAGRTVEVAIQDCGHGVPENQLGSIFKPFHSTKPTGMGIGLTISRATLEVHGGRLWCTNNPDRGATLQFTLPVLKKDHSQPLRSHRSRRGRRQKPI